MKSVKIRARESGQSLAAIAIIFTIFLASQNVLLRKASRSLSTSAIAQAQWHHQRSNRQTGFAHTAINNTASVISHHRHAERSLSDAEWKRKVAKGNGIYCAFSQPASAIKQSTWTRWADVAGWGWNSEDNSEVWREREVTDILEAGVNWVDEFIAEKKLSVNLQDWIPMDLSHELRYRRPGEEKDREFTGAQYSGWLSKRKNEPTYIVGDMYSPRYKIAEAAWKEKDLDPAIASQERPPEPDLHLWSDVVALQYFHFMGGRVDGTDTVAPPRWLVIPEIISGNELKTDTQDAIRKAHEVVGKPLAPFPGTTFDAESNEEAFFGLLGTKHGSGPSYFLLQHKAWFGLAKIDRISVFMVGNIFNMVFSIVPVLD